MKTLGFIGLGNMGMALLEGFANSKSSDGVVIYGYDSSIYKKGKVKSYGGIWADSEIEIVEKCKYILLAVKPQTLGDVLMKIKKSFNAEHVIISICAGISDEYIRSRTRDDLSIVCVMPNTPMMLREGASSISIDPQSIGVVSQEEIDEEIGKKFGFIFSLLASCSQVVEYIQPDKMNSAICINGSSPAFIFNLAKSIVDYAKEQGIEERKALNLFAQSLIGSAKMLTESGMTPDELIAQVKSPGGTTEAGLAAAQNAGFDEAVKAYCEACTKKARELSKNN
jgi:pyrroline-5-carboxylate reductase